MISLPIILRRLSQQQRAALERKYASYAAACRASGFHPESLEAFAQDFANAPSAVIDELLEIDGVPEYIPPRRYDVYITPKEGRI